MELIPIEIIRLISLELSPRYLSLVCKLYDTMYDDAWYYEYLIARYDKDEIIGTEFTFRELCERSLLEGTIYINKSFSTEDNFDTKIAIRGIKCVSDIRSDYILTFNGKLYNCINNVTCADFIDSNVVDIDTNCYIKKYELFILKNSSYQSIPFSTTSQVKELQYPYYGSCNFYTDDTLFYCNAYTEQLSKFIIADGIRKAYTIMRFGTGTEYNLITYILTNKNTLLVYFCQNFSAEPKIINNVTVLGKNYICMNNRYYYFYPHNIYFKFDNRDLILFYHTINSSVSRHYDRNPLIIDKKFVCVDRKGIIMNSLNYNVKRLMGNDYGICIIKK